MIKGLIIKVYNSERIPLKDGWIRFFNIWDYTTNTRGN